MTRSGVPILQALAIVANTSNNFVVEKALNEVQDSVRSGRSIAGPLGEHPVFPSMVVQMISVGEDSGNSHETGGFGLLRDAETPPLAGRMTARHEARRVAQRKVVRHVGELVGE